MGVREFEEKRYLKHTPPTWRQRVASDVLRSGKVLDLGCGDGLLLKQIEKKCDAIGIDISPKAIKKCKEKRLKAKVYDFDGEKLPFKPKSFDFIVMLDVLEHLYAPFETLKEARKVGKRIVIVVPNFSSATARLQVFLGKVPENNTPKKGHVQWITLKVLKNWLKKSNWKIERIEGNYYLRSIPLIGAIMNLLGRVFPSMFTTAFMVVAK